MAIQLLNAIGKSVSQWSCLSTDVKPTTGDYGSRCFETDKNRWFIYTPVGWVLDPVSEMNRFQQEVKAARLEDTDSNLVVTADPAYLLGIMFDATTAAAVQVYDDSTHLQTIPAGTPGGQMVPFFGVKCATNITVILAGADEGAVYYVPVS